MTPEKLIRFATIITLVAAFTLFSSKVGVWYFTDSVSLMAAAVDNIGDFLASLVAFFAARYALRPADDNFSWGYSKAEPLASLTLGAFVCGSAFFLIGGGLSRIGEPVVAVAHPEAVIAVMILSIVITGALFLFQRWAAKRTQSTIIHADSMHYQMDFLLNIAVIVAMLLQPFWAWFDVMFGLIIAVYVLWHTGSHIIMHSFDQLMDKELSQEDRDSIVKVIEGQKGIVSYHDLRTRRSGRNRFVQVHIDLDKRLSLEDAHNIGDNVMNQIEALFDPSEVIVHLDPIDLPVKAKKTWIKV